MKNRINLFKRKPEQDYIGIIAQKIKRYITGMGVVLFVIFLFLMYQMFQLNITQQNLLKKKETYLKYLLDKKDTESTIRYFVGKQAQVNTFLKDDANFLPYYQILKDSLAGTDDKAILDTVDIDKDRNTSFIVRFSSFDDVLLFLKYVEEESFLKNFTTLTLQSFNLTQQSSNMSHYQLELVGVFKKLDTK